MNFIKSILFGTAIALSLAANGAFAKCDTCGSVIDVKTVEIKGEGTGLGAVAGGVLGGVLGHQVGGGRGKDVATVAGALGGDKKIQKSLGDIFFHLQTFYSLYTQL